MMGKPQFLKRNEKGGAMAILAECPTCHRKQSNRNKYCSCGEALDKAKRSKRVRYWITYRLPGGKQRREAVGFSVKEARDAEGKRQSQKREGNIFDILPESKMTFQDLSAWYLNLATVKRLAAYKRYVYALNNFNHVYGKKIVSKIRPIDIENYQMDRIDQGIAHVTIDLELTILKAMISKAFDNDIVGGRVLKAFRIIKKLSSMSERARQRTITVDEYQRLLVGAALPHVRQIMIVLFNTGMRPGEVRGLRWPYIDKKAGFIRLPAKSTKEKATRDIPINPYVQNVLDHAVRHIDHDYVITFRGKPVKKSFKILERACIKAEIPYGKAKKSGIVLHDFRRTFKTNCLKAGIDKVYRDKLAGHSLQGMDAHYIVPTDEDLKEAMGKFTKWLDSELQSVDQNVDQENTTN